MKAIKIVLGYIYAVYAILLFVATMLIVMFPIWIISLFPEPKRAHMLHPVFRAWMGVFMPLAFCPVIRRGKKQFRKGENYVVVINHNSLMDVPVSSPWIAGPNKTLAKIEMSKIPLFGLIYKTGSILVDRKKEGSRRESFARMQETLEQGTNLCLYPEGTRNKTSEPMQAFYDGAFITAIKAQKPVMPGVIFNTKGILSQGRKFWAWPNKIHIHFLEPVPTKGLTLTDVAALKDQVRATMEAYFVAHRNELA